MTVRIIKNFLTKEECASLNEITLQGIKDGWVGDGIQDYKSGYKLRLTSRIYDPQYPQFVYSMADKVRKAAGVDQYPIIDGHGSGGVVTSITYCGGSVYAHKDPRAADGTPTYRCNVLTQANEDGAELYVNGQKIDIGVGDLHCYAVSELTHYATEAKGPTPRIMWMFGAHVPLQDLKDKGML